MLMFSRHLSKVLIFALSALFASPLFAASCFMVKEGNKSWVTEGACNHRTTPACTFNIAIALMAANEGIIESADRPVIQFSDRHDNDLEKWRQAHNPTSWMKNSCLWYSKELAKQLGKPRFEAYLTAFHYGNENGKGLLGQQGLTQSWLSSSLQISPVEQIAFIQKMLTHSFKIKPEAVALTKEIINLGMLDNGWTLYGKTGAGRRQDASTGESYPEGIGWFVGWIEKDDRQIAFAYRVEDETVQPDFPSPRAKALAKQRLSDLIGNVL